jgi:hypothetical protein
MATTLWFLRLGVTEGNPLVSAVLRVDGPPALSLALLKLGACGLGWLAWRRGSVRLLRGMNLFFAAAVFWNLAAIAQT